MLIDRVLPFLVVGCAMMALWKFKKLLDYMIMMKKALIAYEEKEEARVRHEEKKEKNTQSTQQNIAGRITNLLEAAAKLNPTHLVNQQAKIVVHNLGCLSGGSTIHEIFVGWKNEFHTMGIVQVLIGDDLKIWSESPSPEAEFSTPNHPSEGQIDRFARSVAEFVRTYNTTVSK